MMKKCETSKLRGIKVYYDEFLDAFINTIETNNEQCDSIET